MKKQKYINNFFILFIALKASFHIYGTIITKRVVATSQIYINI
ncbi:hypothetical protein [Mycoplasma anserisalpingitidis]|nr:hypothetical protein [Mycoplasma anserisalpingitidis]